MLDRSRSIEHYRIRSTFTQLRNQIIEQVITGLSSFVAEND